MTRRTDWPEEPWPPGRSELPEYEEAHAGLEPAEEWVPGQSGEWRPGDRYPDPLDSDGPVPSRAGTGPSRLSSGARKGRRERGSRAARRDGAGREEQVEPDPATRDPVERARSICLRLLSTTPRTRQELAVALRRRDVPDEAIEEVLARFEDVGLVDDAAFAEAWVESRHHGRGLAGRALARELRAKGMDSAVVDEAVGQLASEQEEETARALVERKLRATRGLDRTKRMRRLAGMLARKGYAEGLALRVVRQALEEEGEDAEALEAELPDL
ncbi:recombination regulator RecX [Streptomyces sp. AJS327]|uniref:recombination regulator RecX n=1 Tax=Streptomyces sp. AJS327 TaxID=2545265 RepID=UPI0015DFCBC5|nr:recombination regulator RecX [Streptomyces sp. AJS327]MBA0051922.1 recombination regulator RecX [Streptomyces sp. AJS327]